MQRITRRASTAVSARKGKSKKVYPAPMSKNGNLVSIDEEKAEILNSFFVSVFTGRLSPCPSPADGLQDGFREAKPFPL